MAKLSYYGIVPGPEGKFTVYAIDQHAIQNFLGWGSDQNRCDGSFYGTNAKNIPTKLKGKLAPGDMPWQWTLDYECASKMLGIVHNYGGDSSYYDDESKKRLPDLIEVLEFVISRSE